MLIRDGKLQRITYYCNTCQKLPHQMNVVAIEKSSSCFKDEKLVFLPNRRTITIESCHNTCSSYKPSLNNDISNNSIKFDVHDGNIDSPNNLSTVSCWECGFCTYINNIDCKFCSICETPCPNKVSQPNSDNCIQMEGKIRQLASSSRQDLTTNSSSDATNEMFWFLDPQLCNCRFKARQTVLVRTRKEGPNYNRYCT